MEAICQIASAHNCVQTSRKLGIMDVTLEISDRLAAISLIPGSNVEAKQVQGIMQSSWQTCPSNIICVFFLIKNPGNGFSCGVPPRLTVLQLLLYQEIDTQYIWQMNNVS